jgi:ParB family chromosome partitioning protein
MRVHWTPTAQSYFARVPKTLILAAVREATGADAAQRIAGMKKAAMAEAAERLVAGTGWLPAILSPRGASVMMADTTSVGSVTEPMVAAE